MYRLKPVGILSSNDPHEEGNNDANPEIGPGKLGTVVSPSNQFKYHQYF